MSTSRATMRPAMPINAPIYTAEQREALGVAVVDRGISPKRIVELAAAGQLELDGRRLDAFATNVHTIRDRARILRKRRAGQVKTELEKTAPRDALEQLRIRLVRLADREIAAEERKRAGTSDPERVRQLARAAREIAAIPDRTEPRPVAPGAKVPGQGNVTAGGATRGGMAGKILQAARAPSPARVETRTGQGETAAQDVPTMQGAEGHGDVGAQHGTHEQSSADTDAPGSWARAQVAALSGTDTDGAGVARG
jgi:hypothetical protein